MKNIEYSVYKKNLRNDMCDICIRRSNNSFYGMYLIFLSAVSILISLFINEDDIVVGLVLDSKCYEIKITISKQMVFADFVCKLKEIITNLSNNVPKCNTLVSFNKLGTNNKLKELNNDLHFHFLLDNGKMQCLIEYNTDLYEQWYIIKLADYLERILLAGLQKPDSDISELTKISSEEQNQILNVFNGSRHFDNDSKTILEYFESEVAKHPNKVAVVSNDDTITYADLNDKANRYAVLFQSNGTIKGSIVAVLLERNINAIASIIGIIKARAAYYPIDSNIPEKRLLKILDDTNIHHIVSSHRILRKYSYTTLSKINSLLVHPIVTKTRPQIKDIDSIQTVNRTLIDYEKYNERIGHAPVKNTISIQATRGCPYKCAYCHKIWPKSHVYRSAENLFEEVQYLYKNGVRKIAFVDDVFNLNVSNSTEFFKLVLKNKIDVNFFFPNGLRGDILTKEFIDTMVQSGTKNIALALETASPRIQTLIGKNLNLDKFLKNIEYITEKYPNVILELFTMIGFPTETEEDALLTLDFIKGIKWVHFPYVFILKIFPNTDMEKIALDNGVAYQKIISNDDIFYHEIPETTPFSKKFVQNYQTRFINEYFLSRERLLHVLPYQANIMTESELYQKYISYLSIDAMNLREVFNFMGVYDIYNFLPNTPEQIVKFDFKPSINIKSNLKDEPIKILFLDVSQTFSNEKENLLNVQLVEPLGLMYLSTHLKNGLNNKVLCKIVKPRIDYDSFDDLCLLIEDYKPDLIGIRSLTYYKNIFHETAYVIKEAFSNIPIIAGGPYATANYATLLNDTRIDLAVIGEGELTLFELVQEMLKNNNKLPDKETLDKVSGIAYLNNKQRENLSSNIRQITIIDNVDYQRRDQLDMQISNLTNDNSNLLYLVSTSGSTGTPKSVMIDQSNFMNLMENELPISFTKVLQFASIGFDVASQEIFSSLLSGGTIYIASDEMKTNLRLLFKYIEDNKVEVVYLPPSFLRNIFNDSSLSGMFPKCIKHIIAAGEPLIVSEVFKEYLTKNNVSIHNHYGPAETHVVTTYSAKGCDINTHPPIGRPIANTQILVLDKELSLKPIGAVGEICISGKSVGRGYYGNPELTKEKYVPNPYNAYERMYKTGDCGRWREDGNIEYVGRKDNQVKIRGIRVELDEITSVMKTISYIQDVLVLSKENDNNEKYLVAYVVADKKINSDEIKMELLKNLLDNMIPSIILQINSIPLNKNGKIDKESLPDDKVVHSSDYISPSTQTEHILTEIWSQVLNLSYEDISVYDNFFNIGGHSLKATLLILKIEELFGLRMPISYINERPYIKHIADFIDSKSKYPQDKNDVMGSALGTDNLVLIHNGYHGKNVFFVHESSGEIDTYVDLCSQLADNISCWGLKLSSSDMYSAIISNVKELALRYLKVIKNVQYKGPYYLVGFSVGGTIAYEISRLLENGGGKVDFVCIVDSTAPVRSQSKNVTIQSHRNLMFNVLQHIGIISKDEISTPEKTGNHQDIWELIQRVDFSQHDINFCQIEKLIPHHLRHTLKRFQKMGYLEYLKYLYIGVNLDIARHTYFADDKINAKICYFEAKDENDDGSKNVWKSLSYNSFDFSKIEGDHYSIMKKNNNRIIANYINKNCQGQ